MSIRSRGTPRLTQIRNNGIVIIVIDIKNNFILFYFILFFFLKNKILF